jgi:hypothetical protein
MKKTWLLIAALTLPPAIAVAQTKINVGSMTVNGVQVRDLSCSLKSGGLMATMLVVGALAKEKKALDSCGPDGAAFRAEWTWAGGKTASAKMLASTLKAKDACVLAVVKKTTGTDGACTATILTGESKAAGAAADTLKPKKE